jgi:peptide/histidine transporter 3/4
MKAVFLIILWHSLMCLEGNFLIFSTATHIDKIYYKGQYSLWPIILPYIYFCFYFLPFPLFGLLADVWIGRFKAITFGIIMAFLSFIIAGIAYIGSELLNHTIYLFIVYILVSILGSFGHNNIQSNIIQYSVDQLLGATSHRLSKVIYLQVTSRSVILVILQLLRCLIKDLDILIPLSLILSGVAVSVVLVTHSLCKHWLESVSLIDNPIKLIVRVLNYVGGREPFTT